MNIISRRPASLFLLAMASIPVSAAVSAQPQDAVVSEGQITVQGTAPADLEGLTKGPDVEGFISARKADALQITGDDGANTVILLSQATEIRGRGGFLGLNRTSLASESLLNGLPVTVETVQWNNGLVASRIRLKNNDLETAAMIRNGTAQRFGEHEVAIEENAAATEALRGRMGDIDKYNIKGTTNVFFDTGKWQLSPSAERELCQAASQAESMDNALLLVVGYTDTVGDEDYNQTLSERRAARVVNYLQQKCRWAPYRMLTPTGMAESDPLADNETAAGRAQNRRVSVNILVSKAIDGL
ncbi:MAG TPA: OmpA family protein [Croceibacterium sp.]|nr:OmpA family protein [Croceibacterium sp.]